MYLRALACPAWIVSQITGASDGPVGRIGRTVDAVLRLCRVQQNLERRDGVQLRRLLVDFAWNIINRLEVTIDFWME